MTKKKLAFCVLSAMMLSSTSVFAADNDLFSDVPVDHWAYDAVYQLAKDGILTGYDDNTFKGDLVITRYEMAQIIANARTHKASADRTDQAVIDKLSDEFSEDLESLGIRVTRLEKTIPNIRITGSLGQEYQKATHEGIKDDEGRDYSSRWRKELTLNLDAAVPKSPLKFHSTFKTQYDSTDGAGFNSEEIGTDSWNGGNNRTNLMRPESLYVEGPIDKTGLDGKFGIFKTSNIQSGFVNDAAVRGVAISHTDDKNSFHFFTGRLDIKDSEVAVGTTTGYGEYTGGTTDWSTSYHLNADGSVDWTRSGNFNPQYDATGAITGYIKVLKIEGATAPTAGNTVKTDNIRNTHTTASNSGAKYVSGGQPYTIQYNDSAWSETGLEEHRTSDTIKNVSPAYMYNHRKTLTGFAWDHKYNDNLATSLGYYKYSSGAYNGSTLSIYSLMADYNFTKKLTLHTAYAKGNQGGYDKAWTAEMQFNGAQNMSSADNHRFGYYIGYRYLAPDALVKTAYEDGAEIGQRGWEGGLVYNFAVNLQGTLKYFNGSSITNPGEKRDKIFTSLYFNF